VGSCRRDAFGPFVVDEPHVLELDGRPPTKSYEGWTSACLGGGTVHMSAMLYRMHPEDLRRATAEGPNSSIDWPIAYAELVRHYDRVQDFLRLSGRAGANPFEPMMPEYPEPPLRTHPAAVRVEAPARALGLHPFPTPRGILTQSQDGARAPCVYCGFCSSYACPVGAKASSHVTFLQTARATGRCRVLTGAPVTRIETDSAGRASAALVLVAEGATHRIRGNWIVMAASAVETARLLLISTSPRHPHGLGNDAGMVGRNVVFGLEAAGRAELPYPSELFPRKSDHEQFLNISIQDLYHHTGATPGHPRVGTLVIEREHRNPIQRGRYAAEAAILSGRYGGALMERLKTTLVERRALVFESFVEMVRGPERASGSTPSSRIDTGAASPASKSTGRHPTKPCAWRRWPSSAGLYWRRCRPSR
jgi:choline dehydrogenase-like flavoprotein